MLDNQHGLKGAGFEQGKPEPPYRRDIDPWRSQSARTRFPTPAGGRWPGRGAAMPVFSVIEICALRSCRKAEKSLRRDFESGRRAPMRRCSMAPISFPYLTSTGCSAGRRIVPTLSNKALIRPLNWKLPVRVTISLEAQRRRPARAAGRVPVALFEVFSLPDRNDRREIGRRISRRRGDGAGWLQACRPRTGRKQQ